MIDVNAIRIELDAAIELATIAGYTVEPIGEVGWGYTPAGVRWVGRMLTSRDAEIVLAAGVDGIVTGATVRVGASDAILIDPSNASVTRAIMFTRPGPVSLVKA